MNASPFRKCSNSDSGCERLNSRPQLCGPEPIRSTRTQSPSPRQRGSQSDLRTAQTTLSQGAGQLMRCLFAASGAASEVPWVLLLSLTPQIISRALGELSSELVPYVTAPPTALCDDAAAPMRAVRLALPRTINEEDFMEHEDCRDGSRPNSDDRGRCRILGRRGLADEQHGYGRCDPARLVRVL